MVRSSGESTTDSLLSRTAPVRFATFTLDLDGCSLLRADGGVVALTHSEFALLREFVRHNGRVLSRDYLLDALAGKRAGPFDRGVDVLVGRLRRKIEADPKEPRLIVTVPGEGYRFDGLTKRFHSAPTGRPRTRRPARVEPRNVVGGADEPMDGAAGSAARPEHPAAPRLSLVVLPFANIGGDASQDYFVDGVAESLTTDLSRISGSVVMARNTAFSYKGKPIDPRAIGRELNIRYVLAGSVQREAARMRVNVQLIDAESGSHLWSERFDKPLADLFDMQDEIVARLANSLNTQLVTSEARRAERAPNPDSMDLYFRGMAWFNEGQTLECMSQARGFFERALALDPHNVGAMVGSAWADVEIAANYVADDRWERLASAETALTKALSMAPDYAWAHVAMGGVQIYTNRAAQGIAECERALALDPNFAEARAVIGLAKIVSGRFEETETHVQEAFRLSPRDKYLSAWLVIVGLARLYLGKDDEAVAYFRRSIEIKRNHPPAQYYFAGALALLGRLDEARSAVRAAMAFHPDFTVSRFRAGAASDNPRFLAARERLCDGMRKAGVGE